MLVKNTLSKIKKSLGRYLSILTIVVVGVAFMAGLQASSDNIEKTAETYVTDYNLMDIKIVSTLGLTADDVTQLQKLDGIQSVTPTYSVDVFNNDQVIRVFALENDVNQVRLIEGRLPESFSEVVADANTYQVGDVITITSDVQDTLSQTSFTVVGTVQSVLFLSNDYGSATIGDGRLTSYIFIPRENFILDVYTEIYLRINNTVDAPFSDAYTQQVSRIVDEVRGISATQENARRDEIIADALKEIDANQRTLDQERQNGLQKLDDARHELDTNYLKLQDAQKELDAQRATLNDQITQQNAAFDEARTQINQARITINASLDQAGLTPTSLETTLAQLDETILSIQQQLSLLDPEDPLYAQTQGYLTQLQTQQAQLQTLSDSINQLDAQELQLNEGVTQFNAEIDNAQRQIDQGQQDIDTNLQKVYDGYETLDENTLTFNQEIKDAQAKIDDARQEVLTLEMPTWHITTRDNITAFSFLKTGITVIRQVTNVFPLFFIAIVVLMTSNSMARMIAEERSELGTLTSLGFKDKEITGAYLLYVLSSSGVGALIGFVLGSFIIPPVIFSTFDFSIPPLINDLNFPLFGIMLLIIAGMMSVVTMWSCNTELKHMPANLMRPLPPKKGQKIFLENIPFIWSRLSFTWKVTIRNMFRYKKRGLMTLVGVSACTGLLVTGFGIRDSVNGVVEKQYNEIFTYDSMVILSDALSDVSPLQDTLELNGLINPLFVNQNSYSLLGSDQSIDAIMIVPENLDQFETYFNLVDFQTQQPLTLEDNKIILSQNAASLLSLSVGESLTFENADKVQFTVEISGIAENYLSNYIFMTPHTYETFINETLTFNSVFADFTTNASQLGEVLMALDDVVSITFTQDIIQAALDANSGLNSVVTLIVIIASILALVVLYNLTSINISERIREIATLKVLGFKDHETNAYIYREALILSIIAIFIGMGLGIGLHRFVIGLVELVGSIFFRTIEPLTFVISFVMTLGFIMIMQGVTYLKIKTINMIESLKSVE
ncbi:hypothetical protein AOC36_08995 [Erysipelothrix larvae]|uniref:ABC3 transporter permease C-terminal domain-containing protein n=1 Tax=Erysipelothrix larvae TaxID=1514105 RepID=A0A0X8H109_9FIRM|nr:FtsX-like permease family protein [Erysipelothrix larvae]AMC94119.1 hypothetical protein AOC36_08995 [Erysipelothrix larvae]